MKYQVRAYARFIWFLLLGVLTATIILPVVAGVGESAEVSSQTVIQPLTDNLTAGRIPLFHKLEVAFRIAGEVGNPYDPGEIAVDAIFKNPLGHLRKTPCFYYQPFKRRLADGNEVFSPGGQPHWRLRFTPDSPGAWSYQIIATRGTAVTQATAVSFEVVPPSPVGERPGDLALGQHGFIRALPGSGYLTFDDGNIFIPIGSNVAWSDQRGMVAYETWFAKMSESGANFARVWLAPWGFAPEWNDTALGNYTNRQTSAWQLDYLFDLAEKNEIHIMLCLLNHGQFSTGTDPQWDQNPYNIKNGGFLKEPAAFLSDPGARRLFKQKVRYIVARWGYSPNLFAWEWWNEVNLTDGLGDQIRLTPWLNEMTAYLKSLDPYNHLVTNSYSTSSRGDEPVWNVDGINLVQIHKYNLYDWAEFMSKTIAEMRQYTNKPLLFGEFGLQQGCTIDLNGVHFREGLWGGLFSGATGTGMLWFWDQYIEKADLYRYYRGISNFFQGEQLQQDQLHPTILPSSTPKVEAYGLIGPKKALVWLKSSKFGYRRVENSALQFGIGKVVFPEVKKAKVTIPELTPGVYIIEQWDPETGVIVSRKQVRVTKKLILKLPDFKEDLAYKIRMQ